MQYLVKLIVFSDDHPVFADRVTGVISRAGGSIRESECKRTSSEAQEHYVTFLIRHRNELPAVLRAVESLRGVGVMAVTDPEEVPDRRRA
ncbi:MAG: hypothetical protein HY293_05830 [Planctomycetes bacterium]|nr:hypothetical protein [Planctomycetota bacterium]